MFVKIVFHSGQLRIPLISSLRKIYLCHAVLYMSSFSKSIMSYKHLIFKNEINNIFPSQKSFLLLSSDMNASFANKPIKFCCSKPNTWRHVFVVVVYVLPSTFSSTTFFAVGIFPKFRGLRFHSFEKSPKWGVICIWVGSFSRWFLQNSSFLFMTIMWKSLSKNQKLLSFQMFAITVIVGLHLLCATMLKSNS